MATVDLPTPATRSTSTADLDIAADAVPRILPYEPIALEGLDDRLVSFEKEEHLNTEAMSMLPDGAGWLMVQSTF